MMIIVKDKVFTFREFCQFAESNPSQEDIRLLIFECELLLDDYKSSTPSVDDIAYIINEFVAPSLRFQSKNIALKNEKNATFADFKTRKSHR